MNTAKFTVNNARNLHARLVKVANDMLDVAAAPPQEGAGTAGPQEVVDALEVVIDELVQVSEAIPAEPTNGQEDSLEAPVEEPQVDAPVEEEEPRLAKQVQTLTAELDAIKKEKIATQYAELFDEPKIQQAKYDEVIASTETTSVWTAKINSIEQYKQNEGASSSKYAKADNMTSWLKPRSKFAKQNTEMMNL